MVKSVRTTTDRPRLTRCCQASLLACAMVISTPGAAQNTPSIGDALNQLGGTLNNLFNRGQAASGAVAQPPRPVPTIPPNPLSPPAAGPAAINPKISASHRALFAKGTVNGDDLYETLKAMRIELRNKRSAAAWSKLSLAMDKVDLQTLTSGNGNVMKLLQETAASFALEMMKGAATNVAMKTLDDYLQYLLDERRTALAEEKVTLPSIEGMTEAQASRIITMATLVVAARLSGKVLDKADQDFKSLETDYKSLLDQREKAAKLLFATIDQRRNAQRASDNVQREASEADMKRSLSSQDITFIDNALNTMTLKEFSNDMAAQNLALQYMQSKDPAAFQDYRTKADEVVRRTSAYVRTVSGVAAFGGLALSFGHTIAEIAQEKNMQNLFSSLPLGLDFVQAAAPLAKKSVEVAVSGVGLPKAFDLGAFFGMKKSFTVSKTGTTQEVSSSKEVFKFIQTAGVSEQFVGALFLNDTVGWLNRIRICDPIETGRMLDAAVSQDERSKFATDYFGWQEPERAKDFAFMNAFSQPGPSRRERELGDELLGKDHRREREPLPLPTAQRAVEKNYGTWSDEQLLRIIFHNRESGAAYATLDIGDVSVRPIPSPEAVYAYESRVEACRKSNDQMVAPPPDTNRTPPAPVTSPAPGPKPKPAPPKPTTPPKK